MSRAALSARPGGQPGGQPGEPLLSVRRLSVAYGDGETAAMALEEASFELCAGEALGVLGESGSGKSTLCQALLGILPPAARVLGGEARFAGIDLLRAPERTLRRLRGDRIAMIAQEPGLALSPCLRVGEQIADVARAHRHPRPRRRALRAEILELLAAVRLADPARVFRAYPHQLSGGEQQRAIIAQALVCEPSLLVADEPTASLDATVQAELVALLHQLRRERGLALLFVSHDPALLAELADRLLVVYGGRVVERGGRDRVLLEPAHPYTAALIAAIPAASHRGRPLPVVPDEPPDAVRPPDGCPYEPRCPERQARCRLAMPAPATVAAGHSAACVLYGDESVAEP